MSQTHIAHPSSTIKDNFLRIGDYVSFKFPKHQAYLSAEGILNEDVYVSPIVSFFEEHLFQLYVQRQYSATNELEEFLELNQGNPNLSDPATASYMEALTKGKENEGVLNRNVMKSKTGNIVYFGDTIQLLHVKSNKFVTVKTSDLARDERENMRVALSYDGSIFSWIKVVPRFKINRDGEPIANGTEILLRVSERSNEFLHCADRPPPRGKFREINSSLELPTGWKVSLFQRSDEIYNPSLLLTGQLMTIKDPESQCMLAPLHRPISLERPNSGEHRPDSSHQEHHHDEMVEQISRIKTINSENGQSELDESNIKDREDDTISLTSNEEFVRDHGNVIMKPITDETIDSDCIWMMESRFIIKGGALKYKTDRVHFRHVNSGKYLAIRLKEDSNENFVLVLEKDPDERYTLWYIQDLHGAGEELANTRAVQIKHAFSSVFLQRGVFNDSQKIYSCLATRSKSKAVSVIAARYHQPKSGLAGTSIPVAGKETLDLYFAKAVMYFIQKYVRATEIPEVISMELANATFWGKLDITDRSFFSTLIIRTTFFVKGYPIAVKPGADFSKFRAGKALIIRRQNMLREVGVLESLMVFIKLLQPISRFISAEALTNRLAKTGYIEMGKIVLSECLTLIHTLIKENITNQLYISDHLLTILSHISTDKMAAQIAQELLSSNRELQETKIGMKEITIFTQRMREIHMNSMYLNLLRTCCSCLGKGLPRNQEIVNKVLFHQYSDVLIQLRVDSKTKIPLSWNHDSEAFTLFYHTKPATAIVRGDDLFTEGMPTIRLTWQTKSHRFAITSLFNREEVLLADVVERDRGFVQRVASSKLVTSSLTKESHSDDLKRKVADFFISQLSLVGEMCLDRNYTVLLEMEKKYPFEVLLTILKSSNNEWLRSSVAYLIHHVYVNREPQSETPVPRFTRTMTEINESQEMDFVTVGPDHLYQFAFLQILISEHLAEIQGKPFTLDSLQMLQLLHSLVRFHYYGNSEKLSHKIGLLVNCLKRGDYDCLTESHNELGLNSAIPILQRSTSRKSLAVRRPASRGTGSKDHRTDEKEDFTNLSEMNDHSGEELLAEKFDFSIHMLEMIESRTSHVVMVFFAIAACCVTIYEVVTDANNIGIRAFESIVLAVFVWELLFHILFFALVHHNVHTFFYNQHNLFDFLTVALFTLILVSEDISQYVKFLRLSRFFVLYKIYYAVVQDVTQSLQNPEAASSLSLPLRYIKTSEYTLKCLVEEIEILIKIQKNLEDRALSICLKKFAQWQQDTKVPVEAAPDIFVNEIAKSVLELTISDEDRDEVFMDLLMYSDQALVQGVLDLLMMHHSSQKILIENMNKLQLITSSEDEALYSKLEQMIHSLKRHGETHDIWGKLENEDHKRINNEMHANLRELLKDCRKRREVLKFNESFEPVKFIQNILRNLGCFEVCMKISQLVFSIDENDPSSEIHKNTRQLAFESNELLYWFTVDNPVNQQLAYGELKFFIKTVDAMIFSHRVIRAIFKDNIDLMELVPKKYIGEFVELICSVGKFPQYLSLMSSIINVGEKNMIRNQYEVIKLMSNPENLKKITQYFVNTSHPEYQKKIRLMSHYLTVKDVTVEELPSDLAYHLELMQLLSSCTIGTSGMTSIEAKVQGMFHFVDVIEGMLDPNCLLLGKIRLGLFLYNAALDVETPIPAMKDAACIWKLLFAAQDVISFAKDELRQIEKNGWDYPTSNRQRIEYMIVNVMIVESYFKELYAPTIYKPDFGQVAIGVERVQMKEAQGNEIITSLFYKIQAIYEMMSPLLPPEHYKLFYDTLVLLNDKAKEKIVANVENIHEAFMKAAEAYESDDHNGLKSYEKYLQLINSSEEVKKLADEQIQNFLEKISKLPTKNSLEKADVRFEPLIEKLVAHIRSCVSLVIQGDETIKFMNPNATKTSIWILRMFRTMIENLWGMNIYERDEDGGEEEDEKVVDLMKIFNSTGVTQMCLDLIAKGIEISLQSEALKLMVGMLLKSGGAIEIQKAINRHLSQSGSDLFFRTVRQILHNLMSWHKWNGLVILEEGKDPELPDEIILVRCLQLMCEGHYGENQDLFREQPNNYSSVNLLDDFVAYLHCLDPIKCRTSTAAELAVTALVLEVIQGPCEGNQNHFALNTELVETLNRKIRQHPEHDCDEEEELELKKNCVDILQALLEGQGRKTAIYERMLSVIHIDVILVLCKGSHGSYKDSKEQEESDASIELKTESLVLLQMLTDFRPELKVEYGLDEEFMKATSDTVACIEVVWRGELQRRFFHIPDICHALAKSTKDSFITDVKRDSPENKLYGLLDAAKEMYREVKHQQHLTEIHLSSAFSRTNQDRINRANFYLVCVINLLFLLFYTTEVIPCDSTGLYDSQLEYIPYYPSNSYYGGGNSTNSTTGNSTSTGNSTQSTVQGAIVALLSYYYSPYYDMSSVLPYVMNNGTNNGTAPNNNTSSTNSTESGIFCTAATIQQSSVRFALVIFNIILIVGAAFSVLSALVVSSPVNFQRLREKGFGLTLSLLYTGTDLLMVYTSLYLLVAALGLLYHPCLSFLLLDFIKLSSNTRDVLKAVWDPRRAIIMTIILIWIFMYIYAMFEFFFFVNPNLNNSSYPNFTVGPPTATLGNFVKYMIRYGFPYASPENQEDITIYTSRLLNDVSFFVVSLIMLNILKGITIDTFISIRKKLEDRIEDTEGKCFICGIEKNTFNRTLDRNAFKQHIQNDQHLWNYIYFIMFIWEQDKDDDDGLETYIRKCIRNGDLTWFPMNKAMRLAQHQEKGDVTSLKYRVNKDMEETDITLQSRMSSVKEQITRTIGRIEKSLEYDQETEKRIRTTKRVTTVNTNAPSSAALKSEENTGKNTPINRSTAPKSPAALPILRREVTALDADILGQMHLRIVAITGFKIPPSLIKYINVRVISNYERTIVQPLTNLERVTSLSESASPISRSQTSPITESHSGDGLTHPAAEVHYRSKSLEKVSISIQHSRSSFILNRPKSTGGRGGGGGGRVNDPSPRPPVSGRSDISIQEIIMNPLQEYLPNNNTNNNEEHSVLFHEKEKVQLRFDILNDPPTLCHQGLLPSSDLAKITIKAQVIFNLTDFYQDIYPKKGGGGGEEEERAKSEEERERGGFLFLGGAMIPLTTLFSIAHQGKLLDVPFIQPCIEIPFAHVHQVVPDKLAALKADGIDLDVDDEETNLDKEKSIAASPGERKSNEKNSNFRKRKTSTQGTMLILPSSDACSLTVSSVASYRILEDWALLQKRE